MHVFTTQECDFMYRTFGVPCACSFLTPQLAHKFLVASHCWEAFKGVHLSLNTFHAFPVLSYSNFGPSKQQLQLGLLAKTNTQPHRHHLCHIIMFLYSLL